MYVGMTRARDELYVCATRAEESPSDVSVEDDDHFAEILSWALAHPEAARMISAEQLELPGAVLSQGSGAVAPVDVEAVVARLEQLRERGVERPPRRAEAGPRPYSWSQLHQFEVCPVRYRFQEVWQVPAPPDELLPLAAGVATGAAEKGAAVHQALAAWHTGAGKGLIELYDGPPEGLDMLRAYLDHPLAAAPTLAAEAEFSLRLDPDVRVTGVVDRVCEFDGQVMLVDYKTNARLDERLRSAYAAQLRLYGLAAARGLLPGGAAPRLALFDLRRTELIEVGPDDVAAEAWVRAIAARIQAGDFALGPEHRDRPCFLCAYRPLCPDRR